jgi:NADPH:quinone reductase-like Zn-dependent oxidoreductase
VEGCFVLVAERQKCLFVAGVLVPLPDQVSFSDAAQLLVNPMTALGFLETMVNDGLKDNDIYVLTGGNSALCKVASILFVLFLS